MGRDRLKKNGRLPPYVYPKKARNCYIHRQYLGSEGGKAKWGKESRLCSLDAPISEVWQAYESLEKDANNTLRWLLDAFNESEHNRSKKPTTQRQHEMYRNSLVSVTGKNGDQFGDLPLISINRRMIRRYLDVAEKKVGANRHIQYMKAAWNWGSQRYSQVPEQNPCEGVTLNKEESRTRYIDDWEYQLVIDVIHATTRSPYLVVMMELAYLCRLRNSEVRALKHSDIQGDLLKITRGKGSLGEFTKISPRLQAAINMAKAINPGAPAPIKGAYLLHDAKGMPISKNRFDSAWKRAMDKAVELGIAIDGKVLRLSERFTFHDIKAKGLTDHTEHWAGHKSEKARLIYMRKLQEVEATR